MDIQGREAALQEKREIWRRHIESWQSSGVSQKEYCRQHELKYSRFVYWKQKYIPSEKPAVSSAIVELPFFSQVSGIGGSSLRVVVSSGYRIEVERDFDPVALGQLIDLLNRL
jgi:hypothetical protein